MPPLLNGNHLWCEKFETRCLPVKNGVLLRKENRAIGKVAEIGFVLRKNHIRLLAFWCLRGGDERVEAVPPNLGNTVVSGLCATYLAGEIVEWKIQGVTLDVFLGA